MTQFTQDTVAVQDAEARGTPAAAYLMKHAGATALVIVLRAPEPGESEVLASHR
jgi:hypothetical protein